MKGDKTQISYLEWHNYYHSCLLSGNMWAWLVFIFFNNSLFKASSSLDVDLIMEGGVELDNWELEYQNAFEGGIEAPAASKTSLPPHQESLICCPPTPSDVPIVNALDSISGAIGGLTLDNEQAPPPPPPPPPPGSLDQVVKDRPTKAPGTKGKVRGTKGKQRGKTAATVGEVGVGTGADIVHDDSGRTISSNAQKTRCGRGA